MDTLRDATEKFPAYEQLLDARNIPAKAKPYYLRWAKAWITTAKPDNPSAAREFFQCLGRRANLPAWQFQQAVRAVAWLARDILHIPWAEAFDWRGLADQAKPLEPDHRTLERETIRVPPAKSAVPAGPLPETASEVARICEEIRRAVRLGGLSYATEQTYVQWNARFTRFCLIRLKQTPQDAGAQGSTAWNIRWSSFTPQMLTPRSLMSVQSTARTAPGRTSCEKKTSFSFPCSSRHCRTRRWKVLRTFSSIPPAVRSLRCSKSAFACSSGAVSNIPRASLQTASSGSFRVRQSWGCFSCLLGSACRRYFRAVLRETPAFIALMVILTLLLRS